MTPRSRRSLVIVQLALMVAACGPAASTASSPATTAAPTPGPSAEASPPSAAPTSAAAPGQTDTDWGRIWDAVPAGFPRYPGATPADDASAEPASARFAVQGGDPAEIASWMQDALELATFSTASLNGPREDGGYLLDSAGDAGCLIQTSVVPQGSMTFVTVLYGAACPPT